MVGDISNYNLCT